MRIHTIPYPAAAIAPVKAADFKVWMAKHLEKIGWHISLDEVYKDVPVDIVAECAQTTGLFIISDLGDCYTRSDGPERHELVLERVGLTRKDLAYAAAQWSDHPTVETYEMYLNCLRADVMNAGLEVEKKGGGKVTGTIYCPHHTLKDGNICVAHRDKPRGACQNISVFSNVGGSV